MNEQLNNAPCGFLSFADDGSILEINATLLILLGYERGELEKRRLEFLLPAGGRIFYQTHLFPLLKLQGKAEEIYLPLKNKAGEAVPTLVNAVRREETPPVNECIFVAIRQRSQYEDDLLKAKKTAEEASQFKDDFLATMSHELRTPLNAVLGWAHLLQQGGLDEEITKNAVETILRNAQSQQKLIEDLLDVLRIMRGKLRLDVRSVELIDVINEAIQSIQPAADAKNIRVQAILDPQAGRISGDTARLQQVIWNLLSNAVKFTPRGGRVHVRLERADAYAQIVVTDNGQGIAPEFLPFIFERFRQADQSSTRRHGGLGLGLAIVRHLVELHGGSIYAHSKGEGCGTSFTVRLPLMVAYAEPSSEEGMHPTANTESLYLEGPRFNGLRVLVVDDEPDNLTLLEMLLQKRGAQVITATSAVEALEKLEQVGPDVLVSDIGMPDMSGYDLIRQVRKLAPEHGGNIPAVALTAFAREEDRVKALLAGFQIHLAKPVNAAELAAVIASVSGFLKKT